MPTQKPHWYDPKGETFERDRNAWRAASLGAQLSTGRAPLHTSARAIVKALRQGDNLDRDGWTVTQTERGALVYADGVPVCTISRDMQNEYSKRTRVHLNDWLASDMLRLIVNHFLCAYGVKLYLHRVKRQSVWTQRATYFLDGVWFFSEPAHKGDTLIATATTRATDSD